MGMVLSSMPQVQPESDKMHFPLVMSVHDTPIMRRATASCAPARSPTACRAARSSGATKQDSIGRQSRCVGRDELAFFEAAGRISSLHSSFVRHGTVERLPAFLPHKQPRGREIRAGPALRMWNQSQVSRAPAVSSGTCQRRHEVVLVVAAWSDEQLRVAVRQDQLVEIHDSGPGIPGELGLDCPEATRDVPQGAPRSSGWSSCAPTRKHVKQELVQSKLPSVGLVASSEHAYIASGQRSAKMASEMLDEMLRACPIGGAAILLALLVCECAANPVMEHFLQIYPHMRKSMADLARRSHLAR
jgi:hypothetical protein